MDVFHRCANSMKGSCIGILLLLLSACGGGGSDSNSNSNSDVEQVGEVEFVSPYIGMAGASQEVIIRGGGFNSVAVTGVSFGENLATEIDIRSDTEIRASFPVLAAGTYPIEVSTSAGEFKSSAELVVVDAQTYSDAAVAASGAKSKLLYDSQRRAIYTADYENGILERLRYDGGDWNVDQLPVEDIRDIALTLDGAQIIAVTPHALMFVDTESFSTEESVEAPELSDASEFLDNIAIANNGVVLLSVDSNANASTGVYTYSLAGQTFESLIDAGGPWELAATVDGSRVIIAAEADAGAAQVYEYNAASGEVALSDLEVSSTRVVADRSGQHFLLGGDSGPSIYDSQLRFVAGAYTASSVFSADGERLYVYTEPDAVAVYDLDSQDGDTGFTRLMSIELPTTPGGATQVIDPVQETVETNYVSLTITPDDQNLILAGSLNTVVVPVPDLSGDDGDGGDGGDDDCTENCDRPWEAITNNIVGFGDDTTGGKGAELCHVTNLNNSGSGSLRACAEQDAATWIVFDVSGTIEVSGSSIDVQSNKTIDGRGQRITLTGRGLIIEEGVENVIVHNIRFEGADGGERDALTITEDVSRVWVDHCDFTAFTDGLLDITVRSTDITVSWNHFWDHGKGMLISASDSDTFDDIIRVTIHHNYFHDIIERQPRVRFGRVHVFNNLIKDWQDYGIRSAIEAKVLVENNIFSAGNGSRTAVEVRQDGAVRASGNLLLNGAATIPQNKTDEVFDAEDYYSYKLDTANSALQSTLESETGWQDVALPQQP